MEENHNALVTSSDVNIDRPQNGNSNNGYPRYWSVDAGE